MTPKNLADEVRNRTQKAKKRNKRVEAGKAQKKRSEEDKLKREMAKVAKRFFANCQAEISKAAEEGKTSIRFSLGERDKETELRLIYLRDHLVKLLEKDGFKAKMHVEVDRPIGSDPEVFYPRYYWYLIISW